MSWIIEQIYNSIFPGKPARASGLAEKWWQSLFGNSAEEFFNWLYTDPQFNLFIPEPRVQEYALTTLKNCSPFVILFFAILPLTLVFLDRRHSILRHLRSQLFRQPDVNDSEDDLQFIHVTESHTQLANPAVEVQSTKSIQENDFVIKDEDMEFIFVQELDWDSYYSVRGIYQRPSDGQMITIRTYESQFKDLYYLVVNTLRQLGHSPFFEKILDNLETEQGCHILTPVLIPNGSLRHLSPMAPENARFYMTEILVAMHYLNFEGFYLESLSASNIYVDQEGHLVLTHLENIIDVAPNNEMKESESLLRKKYGYGTNIRYLGVILYELLTGENLLLKYVRDVADIDTELIANLLKLLPPNESELLGFIFQKDFEYQISTDELYTRDYFKDIEWDLVATKKLEPPFRPS